ncbi:hypothetical protein H4F99_12965 [Lysobacter sp. SG-8]|uniref:Lipoprotein n=1 Tax=Marilutibacter penaei TaxID=2759900 RepID=A0A7W3U5M2_9GAMM|nr:hypothetical protein [Lysobacter penaei]MBB1089389.1 hypothetical protein [Lysobacter penaei]
MSTATHATRLVALGLCTSLAGCSGCATTPSPAPAASPYGDACPASPSVASSKVHVRVTFPAPGGPPSTSPASCYVTRGTDVYLVTDEGVNVPFAIQFKQAGTSLVAADARNPSPGTPGVWEGSQAGVNRQALLLEADANPGNYPYNIRANGHTVDPVIIIRLR